MVHDYFLELVRARVSSADRPWVDGILVEHGKSLPFVVERFWSGPAGTYLEQWSIRDQGGGIVYRNPPRYVRVRGMQSVAKHDDRVDDPIAIEPGTYDLVFIVEGYFMGSVKIEVRPPDEAAA